MEEREEGDGDGVGEGGRPYFQTTVRIGKSDMQLETNRAVETAFGVGARGGAAGVACALIPTSAVIFSSLLLLLLLPSSSSPSTPLPSPSANAAASQRIVRCCASVVALQRNR